MKIPNILIVATAVNCGLVLVNLAQLIPPARAQSPASVSKGARPSDRR
jgi:hypothetical protein